MFTGVTLPFTLTELITTAFELMTLFGPYILLGLGLILMPRFVAIFKGLYRGGNRS